MNGLDCKIATNCGACFGDSEFAMSEVAKKGFDLFFVDDRLPFFDRQRIPLRSTIPRNRPSCGERNYLPARGFDPFRNRNAVGVKPR